MDEPIVPGGPATYCATLPIRAGWIHRPALPSVAALEANLGMPSMTVETSRAGVEVAIRAALAHPEDIRAPIRSARQI